MARHFLSLADLDQATAMALVERAAAMKRGDVRTGQLAGKTVILLFEKASTRTRISFEVAVRHLGGETIFMSPAESQLGRGEPLKDTARVLSRYADCLVVRTFGQEKLEELARYGTTPVVNALTDRYHPCQVLCDVQTMCERLPDFGLSGIEKAQVAWVGDGNNMANSMLNAAALFGFSLKLAAPEGFEPEAGILEAAKKAGADVTLTRDPAEAVYGAHFVHTDVWASMGQEEEAAKRLGRFQPFQVNAALMGAAHPEAKFMHCLPAHRGEEVTDEVIESKASIVWDQAENRLHIQKAILEWLMGEG